MYVIKLFYYYNFKQVSVIVCIIVIILREMIRFRVRVGLGYIIKYLLKV